MTRVRMGLRAPVELAGGRMEWRPRRHVDGADVVLPVDVQMVLVAGVETFAEIRAGVWWVDEFVAEAGESRVVLVPDTEETVNYADLVDVDPATLDPVGPAPVDAWAQAVRDVAVTEAIDAATAALEVLAPELLVSGRVQGRRLILTDRGGDDVDAGEVVPTFIAGDVATGAPGAAASLTLRGGPIEWFLDATLPKGEPGGLPFNQLITPGAHADTLSAAGRYQVVSASGATLALGYPIEGFTGIIDSYPVVANGTNNAIQEAIPYASSHDGRVRYVRRRVNTSTWGPWRGYTSTRVDRAEGGPTFYAYDADAAAEVMLVTHGQAIGTADLNTIASVGLYRQPTGSAATASRNYPEGAVGLVGLLEVVGDQVNSHRLQRYTPYGNGAANGSRLFYQRRTLDRGVAWGEWRAFTSQRVDKTAGLAVYTWDDVAGREQLIYGDTGSRDVTSLLVNGWTAAQVLARRQGYRVAFQVTGLSAAAATDQNWIALPVGFRAGGRGLLHTIDTPASAFRLAATTGASWTLPGTTGAGVVRPGLLYGEFGADTTDAWPTTLPGTPSGSIPNL